MLPDQRKDVADPTVEERLNAEQQLVHILRDLNLPKLTHASIQTRFLRTLFSLKAKVKRWALFETIVKLVLYPSSVSVLLAVYNKYQSSDVMFWVSVVVQLLGYAVQGLADKAQLSRKLPMVKRYTDELEHEIWCFVNLIDQYHDLSHQDAFPYFAGAMEAIISRNERSLRQTNAQTRNPSGSYRNTDGPVVSEREAFGHPRIETMSVHGSAPVRDEKPRASSRLGRLTPMEGGDLDVPRTLRHSPPPPPSPPPPTLASQPTVATEADLVIPAEVVIELGKMGGALEVPPTRPPAPARPGVVAPKPIRR